MAKKKKPEEPSVVDVPVVLLPAEAEFVQQLKKEGPDKKEIRLGKLAPTKENYLKVLVGMYPYKKYGQLEKWAEELAR